MPDQDEELFPDQSDDHRFLARLNRFRDRWRDGSLSVLLVVQILTIFALVPLTAEGVAVPSGAVVLLLLTVMSLTILLARGRWTLSVGLIALLLVAASSFLRNLFHAEAAEIGADLVASMTFVVLTVVVFMAVFRPGRFTGHRVRGAVVLYLNLGLLFAFAHRIIAELFPGSYSDIPDVAHQASFRAALDYFSFATLTSVGYGDIVPLSPIARSLSTLEAILGQLLPTVLIARVVTLSMREND